MVYIDEPNSQAADWNVPQNIRDRAAFCGDHIVGVFSLRRWDGYGWLLRINPDIEDDLIMEDINANVKGDLRVYRYLTMAMGWMPLIKINVKSGLVYFLDEEAANPVMFETRGLKSKFVRLLSTAI